MSKEAEFPIPYSLLKQISFRFWAASYGKRSTEMGPAIMRSIGDFRFDRVERRSDSLDIRVSAPKH